MDLDMVLNELSFGSPASNIQTAREQMSNLREVAQLATEYGINEVIRVRPEFYATALAPDYSVSNWLDDSSVNESERLLILALISIGFPLEEPQESDLEDKKLRSDFFYNEERAESLGLAYLSESLALSMRTEPPDPLWEPSIIELQHKWIEEDGEDEEDRITINSETVEVHNASKIEHIQEHILWIQDRLKNSVRDGLELWRRKDALFPNLEFCKNARKQIEVLKYGDIMLRPVVNRLLELEQYCKNWGKGAFEPDKIVSKATPESRATLQKYGEERTFLCPDGEERVFSWHVRLTPGAWRIQFWPDEKRYKMIIGHVGRHLRTVKHDN